MLPPNGGNGRSKSSSVNVRVCDQPSRIATGKPGRRPSRTLTISSWAFDDIDEFWRRDRIWIVFFRPVRHDVPRRRRCTAGVHFSVGQSVGVIGASLRRRRRRSGRAVRVVGGALMGRYGALCRRRRRLCIVRRSLCSRRRRSGRAVRVVGALPRGCRFRPAPPPPPPAHRPPSPAPPPPHHAPLCRCCGGARSWAPISACAASASLCASSAAVCAPSAASPSWLVDSRPVPPPVVGRVICSVQMRQHGVIGQDGPRQGQIYNRVALGDRQAGVERYVSRPSVGL